MGFTVPTQGPITARVTKFIPSQKVLSTVCIGRLLHEIEGVSKWVLVSLCSGCILQVKGHKATCGHAHNSTRVLSTVPPHYNDQSNPSYRNRIQSGSSECCSGFHGPEAGSHYHVGHKSTPGKPQNSPKSLVNCPTTHINHF